MTNATNFVPDVRLNLTDALTPIALRDDQRAACQAMSKHYVDLGRQAGMVIMPTGGGKTVVATGWELEHHVRRYGRVLWLAHRRSLLRQAHGTFHRLGNMAYPKEHLNLITISSLDAKWPMVTKEHDVVISSMQSAVLEGNWDFVELFLHESEHGVFVIVDEAHHAAAPGYARLLRRLKKRGCKILGLTATPVRGDDEDQRRLAALFDESIVYQISRQRLVDANILAVPCFETVKTRIEVERDFTAADYKYLERFGEIAPAVLNRLALNAPRNKLIVKQYLDNQHRYGPTIVFAADTLHCRTLAEEFQKAGVNADYVTYDRPDAQAVISRFQERKGPDVLVNVEMLTEGFDAPHTRTVFIARPTRSEVLLTQMVGRALRGTQANGNEKAFLVTFLDTWNQFNVLDPEYVLGDPEDVIVDPTLAESSARISIPIELVREAYRLVSQCFKGHLEGVYQCLPHGWFIWWDTFEDDQQQQTVMVFENQRDGFETLLTEFSDPAKIPDEITEEFAQGLIREYFADAPDPLPRWADVKLLLDARRRACEVHQYTFDEKRSFDPQVLAKQVADEEMAPLTKQRFLMDLWDRTPACGFVYRDNFHAFLEDVSREENNLINPAPAPIEPEIERIVPTATPGAWGEAEPGYNLGAIRDSVLAVKSHFPHGTPKLGELRWMDRVSKRYFGFCRYSDGSISVNPLLNSPDVPLFVMEFLMYHELLHADMPYAGHNPDFKARERLFQPSPEALENALNTGIKPAERTGIWRARADGFFSSFHKRWICGRPGTHVLL